MLQSLQDKKIRDAAENHEPERINCKTKASITDAMAVFIQTMASDDQTMASPPETMAGFVKTMESRDQTMYTHYKTMATHEATMQDGIIKPTS